MRFKMKTARYFRVLAVLYAGISLVPAGRAEHYKVYLLGGQSNASGRGDAAELSAPYDSAQTDVAFYWHKTLETDNGNLTQDTWLDLQVDSGQGRNTPSGFDVEFGPEITFGRVMADAFPDDNIAIIKYAHGGSNLHAQWADSGEMYSTFETTVTEALAALTASGHTYQVIGMFWQQGEADAGSTANADAYEANLTDLIARVRADFFGGLSLPFVIGGLSTNQYSTMSYPETVRLAQETVAANVDGVGFADADDCTVYESYNIHFNWEGQLVLGAAHAAVMLELEALDMDYDGLTANQETALGTDPDNPDSDGDGQKDGFEYRAGTSPINAASLFEVSSIAVSNGAVVLEWPSKSGNAYGVESSSNLLDWTEMEADIPAAGTNTVWTSADEDAEPAVTNILAQYDIQAGENGDFDNEAFDSVDTEENTTAGRLAQGGSLTGGGSAKFVLTYGFFNVSTSGSPGLNLAGTAAADQSAADAAGDWFSFTLEANGTDVLCESLSFYANQASGDALLDVSYTIGGTETFVLQGYEPPGDNSDVQLVTVDFDDISTTNDITWTFYLYGSGSSTHGNRFDDITLYGTADGGEEEPDVIALYDAETGGNGDFNTEAFDSVDTEAGTTASRMFQGGSLSGGGSSSFVLGNALFDTSASGSPGYNLADVNLASQGAAATAGDWLAFTIDPEGSTVDYSSLSFYADQASSGGKVDVSYTTGTTETFILQSYSMAGDNASVELIDVDFDDFSSSNIVTWTFYLYGTPDYRHGIRFDDVTLYGKSDAVIEPKEEPAAGFYRVNLQ